MTQRRGRPRIRRKFTQGPIGRCFEPCRISNDPTGEVVMRPDELEILRLIDLVGMDQESAADTMGISRRTLWRDLQEARRKVAEALIMGKAIALSGCEIKNRKQCRRPPSVPDHEEEPADNRG